MIGSVGFLVWKCRFGLDLTDESFYLAPAWKLFSLGDKPFQDEVFNGARHSDLLNYLLVRPFLPFSVLWIRIAAVLFSTATCFILTYLSFQGRIGLTAATVYITCVLYDPTLMPSWSYNWWVRNLLMIHHCLIFLALSKPVTRPIFILAGMAMGTMVISHNPMIVVFILTLVTLTLGLRLKSPADASIGKVRIGAYATGGLLVVTIDLLYLFGSGTVSPWIHSLRIMLAQPDYSGVTSTAKFFGLVRWAFDTSELWYVLLLSGVIFSTKFLVGRISAFRILNGLILLTATVFIVGRWEAILQDQQLFRASVGYGLAGGIVMVLYGIAKRRLEYLIIGATGIGTTFTMAMASSQNTGATTWASAALLIPYLGLLRVEISDETAAPSMPGLKPVISYLLLLILLFAVGIGAFKRQLHLTYFDVSPGKATTICSVPPFTGIHTSERRAFLVEKLAQMVDGKHFVLAFPFIPGIFMLSQVRSAVDSIILPVSGSTQTLSGFLTRMVKRGRFPELVIKLKHHPWGWGSKPSSINYETHNPFVHFSQCVRKQTLLVLKEFDVYEVDPSLVAPCVTNYTTAK